MLIISESLAQELVSIDDAIEAVAATFIAMAQGKARNYPVVREVVGHADAVFGVKTGRRLGAVSGAEGRGFWPRNLRAGGQSPIRHADVRSRHWSRLGLGQRQLPDRRANRRGLGAGDA